LVSDHVRAQHFIHYDGNFMLTARERFLACWLLAGALLAAFVVPGLSDLFAPVAHFCLFALIVLSLLPMGRLDFNEIFSMDWKIWQIVLWQLIVLPAIIVAAAHLCRFNDNVTALLVTTASAGSLFASPTFAELLQVNKQKALQCMILSTFMMPVSYFFFFTVVLHSTVELDISAFVHRCTLFLILPLGLFLTYMGISRSLPLELVRTVESGSRRLTIIALIGFGIGIVGPARSLLLDDPQRFFLYLLLVTCLGAGMAYLTAIVMFKQGISDALTASIVSGFRNVGLGFVLLPGIATDSTAAYVGVSQIPIFLAPLVLSLHARNFIRFKPSAA
jgi:predicted Na+-dependent transporter